VATRPWSSSLGTVCIPSINKQGRQNRKVATFSSANFCLVRVWEPYLSRISTGCVCVVYLSFVSAALETVSTIGSLGPFSSQYHVWEKKLSKYDKIMSYVPHFCKNVSYGFSFIWVPYLFLVSDVEMSTCNLKLLSNHETAYSHLPSNSYQLVALNNCRIISARKHETTGFT
jgi:hypothetical protein